MSVESIKSGYSDPPVILREVPHNKGFISSNYKSSIGDYRCDSLLFLSMAEPDDMMLVPKKTPYVGNFADCMVMQSDQRLSLITQLSPQAGSNFTKACGIVLASMLDQTNGGMPVVAFNQQLGCWNIPDKFGADGTELKIQTINQLHAHVFVEDGSGRELGLLSQMEPRDFYDIHDPYGLAFSEIVIRHFRQLHPEIPIVLEREKFPFGITFIFDETIETFLLEANRFEFLNSTQRSYMNLFNWFLHQIGVPNQVASINQRKELAHSLLDDEITIKARRLISRICMTTKHTPELEEQKHLRLVQGPALTWVIFEREGKTFVNFTPRIVSRGNAMEAMGILVDPIDPDDSTHIEMNGSFFRKLSKSVPTIYAPKLGNLLSK